MTQAQSLARELHHLLGALALQSGRHLSEVETDLQQTGTLLSEAIEKLGNSFIGMHAAVVAQNALIGTLQGEAMLSPQLTARLVQLQADSNAQVNAGVTALQFHDMTGQLLGRIASHVASLRNVLEGVGATRIALAGADSDACALAVLGLANRILDEKITVVDSVAPKAVAQTHLESGDIELF
ncbi:MAG: chemotaxis protein [Herminiimonas sp.]|nr:chemotaxis protein [Herminiimonas sp.]